jgi:type I restriction enzyme S subunit
MMLLRPNSERVIARFLYHQLRSPQVLEDQLAPCYIGTASPRVNIGDLRRFRLLVPDLPEQRRMVAHLDAIQAKADALRALQAETAAELDALLPAVLAKAFMGEL